MLSICDEAAELIVRIVLGEQMRSYGWPIAPRPAPRILWAHIIVAYRNNGGQMDGCP